MERIRYINRPHLYLRKCKCGCVYWTARCPRNRSPGLRAKVLAARDTAKVWNITRAMGAKPCEHHNPILEQQP